MMTPEILEYYERGGETTRLDAGHGRLEFLRTWDILTRELPPHPARILDVGGATGVYAALGHDVTGCRTSPTPIPPARGAGAAEAGLAEIRTVAVEGPLWLIGGEPTDPALDLLRRVEHEPSVQGASSHLMTITRNRR